MQCRRLAPECRICEKVGGHQHAGQLKQAIAKWGQSHNKTELKDDLWAGQMASQFICLLSHWRRLRQDAEKIKQCLRRANGAQRSTIEELVALEAGVACKKATKLPCKSSSSASLACEKAHEGKEKAEEKRELKAEVSDVSLDSNGYPLTLVSPRAGNTAKIWSTLKEAYVELQTTEKFNDIVVVSMFTNEAKPFSQPAKLKGHAGEIRHFIPALAVVAWKKAPECEAFAHMAEACHQLSNFYNISYHRMIVSWPGAMKQQGA